METNSHVSDKLAKFISKITKPIKNKELIDFAEKLYSVVSYDDLKDFNCEHLLKCASRTIDVLKGKVTPKAKVEYFIDSKQEEYVVLQIVNADIPFLVDSISNELKTHQIDINLITHMMVTVSRDKHGKFISFADEGQNEYVIQIHIPNRFHEEYLENLKRRFKEILECVSYCVEDWLSMRLSMEKASRAFPSTGIKDRVELRNESIDFLEWLIANNFVFLGELTCTFDGKKVVEKSSSRLGLVRSNIYDVKDLPYVEELKNEDFVVIRKWDERSVVHRPASLDVIIVKKYDAKGKCVGANLFFGLFTSTVYYQSVRNIPLIRQKIDQVIYKYGYPESSHNCKELVTALEAFPRGEILQMNVDEVFDTATNIVSLMLIPRVRVILRKYPAGKFVSCIVFIPEKKFSTEVRIMIENIICKKLNVIVTKRYVQIAEGALTRLQLVLKLSKEIAITREMAEGIENDIILKISNWGDELYSALSKQYTKKEAATYHTKYLEAFDLRYKSVFSGSKAIHDIKFVENALAKQGVVFDIYVRNTEIEDKYLHLKIYSPGKEQTLSSTLPIIENLGFEALDVEIYKIQANNDDKTSIVYLSHFRLVPKNKLAEISEEISEKAKVALDKVWNKTIDDDTFNSLIVTCGLDYHQANLIRAYVKYLRQTKYTLSQEYTVQVLLDNPKITKLLVQLFDANLNPNISAEDSKNAKDIEANIKEALNDIKGINEDRAIRSLIDVVTATLRTNYYKMSDCSNPENYCISFKLRSSKIMDLPLPKPYAEVFVYSARFEAIHLRGGKIARGGLRWSDRPEDFRTEVLGLMKAQMTKNSVIVPVGSKGGFIIKRAQPSDGDKFLAEGIACYKIFLSGLLDITDNIVSGKVVTPKDIVRLDGDDPYLVVAADKGTASFSDYANEVSRKYNFWLDDAFASGGSAGYDHKKMAITSRGAWISVVRHFADMGVDVNKQPITCVAIGDMSGDVFGNGMLMSKNIKLLAAFNHKHIFFDPNPDLEVSYKERKRLFDKPRSQWSDYNLKLISNGGGIFERTQKSIPLSNEIKAMLGINDNALSPDNLINAILKAEVDLLWNGGIGTYVKAKTEVNEYIGDKANDAIRIDGSELRAKVVGEGGNLGFTQLGRIEYDRAGGKINTDFIDNSGGVDCSDHEVNIKVALSEPVMSGKIKLQDRNKLLVEMTDEIADLVLTDNRKQTQVISLEQQSNFVKIRSHAWLINHLEKTGELDRELEFLPSNEDLDKMLKDGTCLSRPEISVLLAYAKNSALKLLNEITLSNEKYLYKYLFNYFPTKLVSKYKKYVEKHILASEIIETVLVNDFINMLGCTFFHQLIDETSAKAEDIIKAFVIVREVLDIDALWQYVENLDSSVPIAHKINFFNRIQSVLGRNITWLINVHINIDDVEKLIGFYKSGVSELRKSIDNLITIKMKEENKEDLKQFESNPKSHEAAAALIKLADLTTAFDIIYVAKAAKSKVEDAAKVYYTCSDLFYIRWLVAMSRAFVPRQYLQIVALRSLIADLYLVHMKMVYQELGKPDSFIPSCTLSTDKRYNKFYRFNEYINELRAGSIDSYVAKLSIAIKYIKSVMILGDERIL
jgi:glutamate dehydrogenase